MPEGWHLEKKVSITHIVSTAVIATSVFAWAANMDKRIALLEVNDQRQEIALSRQVERTNQKLSNIEEKIDKLIDRELSKANK